MNFVERYEHVLDLSDRARSLGLALCRAQRHFGDFFLKTLLARVAGQVFWLHVALAKKVELLGPLSARLQFSRRSVTAEPPTLKRFQSELSAINKSLRKLRKSARNHVDTSLEFLAADALTRLEDCFAEIELWIDDGPTPVTMLAASDGLLRDCILYEQTGPARKGNELRDRILQKDSIRALYLSANAYLELSAVDIVSDLILIVDAERPNGFQSLIADLARQLVDEVRHAELLANRVADMGFEFGCAPVTLHSWRAYNSVNTLPEKLAMQHVLQEGVGLDASARNVKKLQDIGDLKSADLYAQIVADEMNHVRLGTRWLKRLVGRRMWKVVAKVEDVSKQIDPLPSIPIAVELRLACGFSRNYVSNRRLAHGAQDLKDHLPQWHNNCDT
ncbi:MAG: ferritin-like domain-containing protein [Gammaproteobacteria bacterium]|nr:ferritin-like domain-containing protein [Gammaproteobacteria bacterium]MDH3372085.1 ferritin-like domain-containing protein [Gammaproteobacteria bacterium]